MTLVCLLSSSRTCVSFPAFACTQFVAVPGNHDLDCECVDPLTWDGLGAARQQRYMEENPAGVAARKARARGFSSFEDFAAAADVLCAVRCGVQWCRVVHTASVLPRDVRLVARASGDGAFEVDDGHRPLLLSTNKAIL